MSDIGYDEAFLQERVPIPAANSRAGATGTARRLDYTHFTVLLDPTRRLAAATAVNIDGALLRDAARADDWFLDPRIPEDEQCGPELYARNDLDRGHLVRRRDPVWGTAAAAARANLDTFAYANAAPQASGFNQSKQLWLGLEDHVLDYAREFEHRVSVFTAPVFAEDDPRYRGVQIPRRFWKVAAWVDDRGLASAGFILDQSSELDLRTVTVDGEEVPPLGPFRTFQVPVADIGAATGLALGPLVTADRLVDGSTVRPGDPWVRLESTDEITLGWRQG